jgi:hypothetical protein
MPNHHCPIICPANICPFWTNLRYPVTAETSYASTVASDWEPDDRGEAGLAEAIYEMNRIYICISISISIYITIMYIFSFFQALASFSHKVAS